MAPNPKEKYIKPAPKPPAPKPPASKPPAPSLNVQRSPYAPKPPAPSLNVQRSPYAPKPPAPKPIIKQPAIVAPTRGQDKRFTNPASAPAINPYGVRIGARGGGGEPPQTFLERTKGQSSGPLIEDTDTPWFTVLPYTGGRVNPQSSMSNGLRNYSRPPSNPFPGFMNYVTSLFSEPESELVNINPAQMAAAQQRLGQSTASSTGGPGYTFPEFNYRPQTGTIPPAAVAAAPAAAASNTGGDVIPPGAGRVGGFALRGSTASKNTGYIPTAPYATYNNVPDRLTNDILDGNLGPYSQQGLAAAAAATAAAATAQKPPPFVPGDTTGGGGGGGNPEGPPANTTTGGGFFGPQTMQDMMAMFTQMKALFGDDGGQLDQIMAMYTELQKSMMDLQNKYIQSLIDAQKPVAPPVAPAPNLGPEAFVPPYISPSAQTGAYLEMSDPGMGALYNMNPLYLQAVQNMLKGLGYTGAGVAGRYGERSYTRPGGPGSLAIGDAAYENAANYVGLPATERENAEAAMRYLFGEMGNSPRFAFPGRPQYPTRA